MTDSTSSAHEKPYTTETSTSTALSARQRWFQLALVVLAAGTIYPLLYLRQYYQPTMVAYFSINDLELGQLYSTLGTVFVLSYLPSGWLADRVAPRILICFSLFATGLLGFLYASQPPFHLLLLIFACWGLSTGLTFWSAVIKRVGAIALPTERGRFFGILDGGRGLVEASLATIAVAIFGWYASQGFEQAGFRRVIMLYATLCITLAVILVFIRDPSTAQRQHRVAARNSNLWQDLKTLAAKPNLWLLTSVVFCGYQLFWSTYNFSAYLRTPEYGVPAAMAAFITAGKMWMRPIGGIGGGWLADKTSRAGVLCGVLVSGALGVSGLILLPAGIPHVALIAFVLLVGMFAYAVRGLYWALLDRCDIPPHCTGLAIGLVSVVGYSPDIYLPLLSGYLTQHFPGAQGYRLFFSYIVFITLCGAFGAWRLHVRFKPNKEA
ncbi:MFS transporter [Enterobacterales bacterium CwR94]|nr:MFS transporter [Enterobacterales bacterium CwR94]